MTMIQTEGKHVCKITDAMLTTAKSGSPQIALVCEVDDEGSDEDKHAITWYGSFSPNALGYTVDALCKACGYSGNGADLWAFLDEVRGKHVQIVTEFSEWQGRTTIKARWLNPLTSAPSVDEQQSLAALLAGAIDQYRGNKAAPKADPPSQDEIPF
jgi:hypothetical protein